MLKDVIRSIDYSDCAEIALALFAFAFIGMVIATLRLSRRATDTFASIPLTDKVQDPRHREPSVDRQPSDDLSNAGGQFRPTPPSGR